MLGYKDVSATVRENNQDLNLIHLFYQCLPIFKKYGEEVRNAQKMRIGYVMYKRRF